MLAFKYIVLELEGKARFVKNIDFPYEIKISE